MKSWPTFLRNPPLDDVRFFDVYPGDANSTRLKLRLGMSYEISIMALNDLGESPYSEAVTLSMSEYSAKEQFAFNCFIVIEL